VYVIYASNSSITEVELFHFCNVYSNFFFFVQLPFYEAFMLIVFVTYCFYLRV